MHKRQSAEKRATNSATHRHTSSKASADLHYSWVSAQLTGIHS
jgi:hypothetical protein